MRRSPIIVFAIGLVVAAVICLLHGRGILATPERWFLTRSGTTHAWPEAWQYILVSLSALGLAWFTFRSPRRAWIIALALILEWLVLMWVSALFRSSFQPLPTILATALSFGAVLAFLLWPAKIRPRVRRHSGVSLATFEGKLSEEQLARFRSGDLTFDGSARNFEASVLVCDIANKYDLADTMEPAAMTRTSERFGAAAAEILRKAGAYLQLIDGEGVVAIFGFHDQAGDHAEKAVRAAFDLGAATPLNGANGESTAGTHVGVSSGSMMASPAQDNSNFFILGEAIELARRFCVANRFYGSRILIGPRTFELANHSFVARPIDFLSGVSAQERHEIYEPLATTAEAPADLIARRDSFWNAIVLYREKRWAEAYSEFQKARGPSSEEDAPLSLYLRRLEPLALHLLDSPAP